MAFNVDRRGSEAILKGFELFSKGAKHYSVWAGKNMKFQAPIEEEDLFQDNIEALKQAASDGTFTVRFHKATDKDGFVTDKTPYISSYNFKVTDETKQMGTIGGNEAAYGNPIFGKLEQILQNQNAIESRLNALEGPGEDEEDFEEANPKGFLGLIENFAATEPGQQMISNMIGAMINKFMPLQNQPILKQTTGIAGIPRNDDEKISEAIERLQQHDEHLADDLDKLATLAETNTATFTMLLGMLRKM
jgi:hypothetical protein